MSAEVASAVDPDTFKRIQPKAFHEQFIQAGVRADGRGCEESRNLRTQPGCVTIPSPAHGSCLVKLGNTTVICGIRAEVAKPTLQAPGSGFLVVNLDIPPIAHPDAELGSPSEWTQSTSVQLHDVFQSVVDLTSLAILPGAAVWCLYADLIVLNHEGGIVDAACAALMSALRHTRLPVVQYDEGEECVQCVEDVEDNAVRQFVPLVLKHELSALTLGVFDEEAEAILLVDPSLEEEVCLSGVMTLFVDLTSRKVHAIHKPGGGAMSSAMLKRCLDLTFAQRRR